MDFDSQFDYSVGTLKDGSLPSWPWALQTQPVIRKPSCALAISRLIARNKDSAISAQLTVASDTWGKVKTSSAVLWQLSRCDRALVKARWFLSHRCLPTITEDGEASKAVGRNVQYRICPFTLIRRCDKAKWSQMTVPFTFGHSIRYFQDLSLLVVPLVFRLEPQEGITF